MSGEPSESRLARQQRNHRAHSQFFEPPRNENSESAGCCIGFAFVLANPGTILGICAAFYFYPVVTGIVLGSIVGGLVLLALAAVLIGAVNYAMGDHDSAVATANDAPSCG